MKDIPHLYSRFLVSSGVSTDTRKIEPNSIFFALKGDNFDGNSYADKALEHGALLAVIDDKTQTGESKMLVDDVLETLQDLANYHRKQIKIPIIAITGSNGKTTTKKLTHEVLSKEFKVKATLGNLNNHIGVPLTLLSFTAELDLGIVEMGANHQKEIEALCKIAEPNYGLITNFGKAHLEGFGGIEGVIKGKSELYDYLIEHDGLIFFNRDDDLQVEKAIKHKNYSIGEKPLSDCQVIFKEARPFVTVEYSNLTIHSKLIGRYNFKNISAAIGIGRYFSVDKEEIKVAIEEFEPEEMRSQILKKEGKNILLDAYNANPTSMEAALRSFKQMESGPQSVILGDMFEVGQDSSQEHLHILEVCKTLDFDDILVCGEHFSEAASAFDKVKGFKTTEELKEFVKTNKTQLSSNILIKGSRGMKLESILDVI
ncbi:UDP-N-acetylmuramoyl-tripeptide--D-alanyl-D-alanine ligase [Psychroflexus sp. YR1-1]|uniref:UDP-N-acetylmuramoyl-tripeptide--D-alanyl-D-alanine ligase n=1 Tax=Psychroflexus aurantiacus TaxID=2709310 RepID=A0A6B3R2W5_9FLAO|nr:UDP-N-acetylmuramoyl-tripeptide--D-alanyl-D-alanine ligase [Psychroflexus aurantiacus]NEV95009.1 UDP-N-acetylmuramoyl-tripeptide--D-alanyl-D-alanine ligase [Psychroflexus aurantiacus]